MLICHMLLGENVATLPHPCLQECGKDVVFNNLENALVRDKTVPLPA